MLHQVQRFWWCAPVLLSCMHAAPCRSCSQSMQFTLQAQPHISIQQPVHVKQSAGSCLCAELLLLLLLLAAGSPEV